jgi:hypothetical protein
MKVSLSEPAGSTLLDVATSIGISTDELADQLLEDCLCSRLAADGAAFLGELAMMQHYDTREAAEVVCGHLEERAVSESLAGEAPFMIATEVLNSPEGYRIKAELLHPARKGWQPAIP